MTTLEQVEKLREKAGVGYDEAKAALDACGGDLLDAIIYLEKQGKVKSPAGGGSYNNEKSKANVDSAPAQEEKKQQYHGETFTDLLNRFGRFCTRAIHKGNVNSFEVFRNGQSKAALPVTVLVLLLIFAFWVTIPLIVIGLFFGFHYRFTGPDLGRDSVNSVMDGAAKAADDIKHSFTETEDTK